MVITSPPLTFWYYISALPPTTLADSNLWPALIVHPYFAINYWNFLAVSWSQKFLQQISSNSITVTFDPNLLYTDPSSNPITPPPITTIVSGIFSASIEPVLDTITFSSNTTPGKGVGSDPVAMMIFLLVISVLSLPYTVMVLASLNDPLP